MKTLEWLIQPFDTAETNVHRNLHTTIRAGKPSWLAAFKLNFRVPLTLPPMNNVKSFGNRTVLPKLLPFPAFSPQPVSDKRLLQATLPEPQRPGHVPPAAHGWQAKVPDSGSPSAPKTRNAISFPGTTHWGNWNAGANL